MGLLDKQTPTEKMGPGVPDVGEDLVMAAMNGAFKGLPAERLVAILELLRHQEITLEQGAALAEIPRERLAQLLTVIENHQ